MQKLIIVRGHSGSGKSTFAQQKIQEFLTSFPEGIVFHIENDKFLNVNGVYHWCKSAFLVAKKQAQQEILSAFQFVECNPSQSVLIIISNVGVNITEIERYRTFAENSRMAIEIYRMQNFFPNLHQVKKSTVYSMFLGIQANPIKDEILVEPIQPMSRKDRFNLQRIKQFRDKSTQQAVK